MTPDDIIERLSAHATLRGVPHAELEWLATHGTVRVLEEGALLTRAGGTPPDGLFIVLSGHIVIHIDRGTGPKLAKEWRAGEVTGMLPYSRMTTPPGDTVAVERTTVLTIHCARFQDMTRECPELTGVLVHTLIDRARLFTSNDLQDEKMAVARSPLGRPRA